LGSVADLAPYLHVDDGPSPTSAGRVGGGGGGRSRASASTARSSAWVVPEVALAGRSNVGKSTLLNALLYGNKHRPSSNDTDSDKEAAAAPYGNKHRPSNNDSDKAAAAAIMKGVGKGPDKAAMSPRPGETRQITLYHISSSSTSASRSSVSTSKETPQAKADDGKLLTSSSSSPSPSSRGYTSSCSLRVADLPGYGFAYSGADDKEDLVARYVLGRDPRALKRLLLLVDARHGLKQADANFLGRLQNERSHDEQAEEEDDGDAAAAGGGGGGRKSVKHAQQQQRRRRSRHGGGTLPPIQLVLTKCDLVPQADLARRVTLVRRQLADVLRREPGNLPVMLVAARSTLLPPPRPKGGFGPNTVRRRRDGVLELQRELAALVAAPSRTRR
jgi:GTP-binding protein